MPGDHVKLQELALDWNYSCMQVWGPVVGNNPLIDEKKL